MARTTTLGQYLDADEEGKDQPRVEAMVATFQVVAVAIAHLRAGKTLSRGMPRGLKYEAEKAEAFAVQGQIMVEMRNDCEHQMLEEVQENIVEATVVLRLG